MACDYEDTGETGFTVLHSADPGLQLTSSRVSVVHMVPPQGVTGAEYLTRSVRRASGFVLTTFASQGPLVRYAHDELIERPRATKTAGAAISAWIRTTLASPLRTWNGVARITMVATRGKQ